jgi:hypothetical protein
MDIIGSRKITSHDEAPEIAVPSGKTVEVKGLWVPPMGFLRQKPVDQVNRFFFGMIYTVYILKSSIDGGYYYGYTADLVERLARHNQFQDIANGII